MSSNDIKPLNTIETQLEEIADQSPNSQSGYDAMTALPEIYRITGENKKSRYWIDRFLTCYPKNMTDQSGFDGRRFDMVFKDALQNGLSGNIESCLDELEKLFDDYEDEPDHAVCILTNLFTFA